MPLLADQLESSGMAAWFGKLSIRNSTTRYLRSLQIYIKMQKYCIFINLIFLNEIYPFEVG